MSVAKSTIPADFSLVDGGPMHRLMERVGLAKPGSERVLWRAITFALFTWLPLLIFSAIEGTALRGNANVPFLLDFTAYGRFLIAVPAMIVAEAYVGWRVAAAVRHFLSSGLVSNEDFPQFEAAVGEATKDRDSLAMELLLVGFIYAWAVVQILGAGELAIPGITWHGVTAEAGEKLNLAGWWFRLVSLPVFQFLWLRWIWRVVLWSKFLWHMSKLRLRLISTHPDSAGGLGFLGETHGEFAVIVFALGAVLSSVFARSILFEKVPLSELRLPLAAFVLLCILIFLGPLLLFVPMLYDVKRRGFLEYGAVAHMYTRQFDDKWVKGGAPEGELILGSADVQSLADIGNSFEFVRRMTIVPFNKITVLKLTVAALAPFLPLTFLIMPVNEVLKKLAQILL
jgi:hypothetical protein